MTHPTQSSSTAPGPFSPENAPTRPQRTQARPQIHLQLRGPVTLYPSAP